VIGFATAPGQLALEGAAHRRGYYTDALVRHVGESGHCVDIQVLLRLVRGTVLQSTRGRQNPWVSGALPDRPTTIVEGDAMLSVVVRAFPAPSVVPGHEVFCGRGDIVRQLLQGVRGGLRIGAAAGDDDVAGTCLDGRVTVLSGLGGVGKSAVAREVCRRARLMYPGGVFWWDADSPVSLHRSLRGMGVRPPLNFTALRDPAVKSEEVREAVLGWLAANTGWLVILDNADNPAFLGPYMPTACSSGSHVLLTSRCSREELMDADVIGTGTVVVSMDVLDTQEALAMLVSVRDCVPKPRHAAVADLGGCGSAEHAAAAWLVGPEALDGLPLALQQAGAYLREQRVTVSEYVARFKEQELALFGTAAAAANGDPWSQVQVWLASEGLAGCGDALRSFGCDR
jgi:hypothetical protein